jgi:hypothetical protein
MIAITHGRVGQGMSRESILWLLLSDMSRWFPIRRHHSGIARHLRATYFAPWPANASGCYKGWPVVRKFLYVVAAIIALVIILAVAYRLNPAPFMRMAMVPTEEFKAPTPLINGYADNAMWIARPGKPGDNPTLWMPRAIDTATRDPNAEPAANAPRVTAEAERGNAAIFFIHPTSYLKRDHWNAPLDDQDANWRALLFVRGMASTLAGAGDVWVPRYHQAAMGAFLTEDVDTANRALNAAYADVAAAFDQFLADVGPDRPIILAGHSQGALHLTRLLKDKVAGRPVASRIAAAYVVGWPVSVDHDLPRMGLPACATADSTNCVLGWQTFAEPADPSMIAEVYDKTIGFDGQSRRGSAMLCVNPINGVLNGAAAASANLGTVKADEDFADGTLFPSVTGARCDGGRGFLLIGEGPDVGPFVLPGNNYHVFDYPLFWANVRADARRRLAAFSAR